MRAGINRPKFKRWRMAAATLISPVTAAVFGSWGLLFISLVFSEAGVTRLPTDTEFVLLAIPVAAYLLISPFYALVVTAPICLVATPLAAILMEGQRWTRYQYALVIGALLGATSWLVFAIVFNAVPPISVRHALDLKENAIFQWLDHIAVTTALSSIGLITAATARLVMGEPSPAQVRSAEKAP